MNGDTSDNGRPSAASDYRTAIYESYVSTHPQFGHLEMAEAIQRRGHEIRQIIRRHFPRDLSAKIVDLGCGHGAICFHAQKAGYANTYGVDASPEQVATAKEFGVDNIVQGDLVETLTSMPDASHDAVICYDVLEHFNKAEIVDLVKHLCRVLKPGGRLILHLPNGASPFGGASFWNDFTHEVAFGPQSTHQLLTTFGFKDTETFEDQPIPHGLKSAVRWLFWKIFRAFFLFYNAVETGSTGPHAVFSRNFLTVAVKE